MRTVILVILTGIAVGLALPTDFWTSPRDTVPVSSLSKAMNESMASCDTLLPEPAANADCKASVVREYRALLNP